MSTARKPSSRDTALERRFGAPMAELYDQVVRVRDRVRESMAPGGDLDGLSAEALQTDVYWMQAALDARGGYQRALDSLLASMPPPAARPAPAVTSVLPPALPVAKAAAAQGR
ncbi:hypothetical protein ACGFRB_23535 [Streptomyces sp. NPDC048718]|uniref:hypothetical protein n=1 Tax=Streptomyces sp. NPDC048718 TaxID=3365587 RepID=UPI00371E01CD